MAFTSAALPIPGEDDGPDFRPAAPASTPFSPVRLTVTTTGTVTPINPPPFSPPSDSPISASPAAARPTRASRHAKEVSLVAVGPLEWLTLAAGVAVLLLGFGDFYHYDLDLVGAVRSESLTAWSGSYAELAACFGFGASALLGVVLLLPVLRGSVALRMLVALGFILALLASIGAGIYYPTATGHNSYVIAFAQDRGHGLCFWFSLLAVLAGFTLSVVQALHLRAQRELARRRAARLSRN